eukprot:tig00021357_g20750.t1
MFVAVPVVLARDHVSSGVSASARCSLRRPAGAYKHLASARRFVCGDAAPADDGSGKDETVTFHASKYVFDTQAAFQEFWKGLGELSSSGRARGKAMFSGRTGRWRVDVVAEGSTACLVKKLADRCVRLEASISALDESLSLGEGKDLSMKATQELNRLFDNRDRDEKWS